MLKISDGVMELIYKDFYERTKMTEARIIKIREHVDTDLKASGIAKLMELPVSAVEKEIKNYKFKSKEIKVKNSREYPKEDEDYLDQRLVIVD